MTPPLIHFKVGLFPSKNLKKEDRGKQKVLQGGDTVSTNLSVLHHNFKSFNMDHFQGRKRKRL